MTPYPNGNLVRLSTPTPLFSEDRRTQMIRSCFDSKKTGPSPPFTSGSSVGYHKGSEQFMIFVKKKRSDTKSSVDDLRIHATSVS